MKGQSVIFLLLFSLIVTKICALEPGEFSIENRAIRFPGEHVDSEYTDSEGNLAAKLIITTDIKQDLKFECNPSVIEVSQPVSNRYDLYLPEGVRILKIKSSGFKDFQLELSDIGINELKSGDVYIFELEGEPDNSLVNCILATIPRTVKVLIDNNHIGTTRNGLLKFNSTKGKHILQLEADGYLKMEKKVEFNDTDINLNFHLGEIKSTDKANINYDYEIEEIESAFDIKMVLVEGGRFTMGEMDSRYYELKGHTVILDSYFIGKYEITQGQYQKVMKENPSYHITAGSNYPIENLSWYKAVEFCNELSKAEGLDLCYSGEGDNLVCDFSANGYRLPTEAEWEYAALGGIRSNNTKYPGSMKARDVAWFAGCNLGKTEAVGLKKPNELGIYDMGGNVWEWCWDWYFFYSEETQHNPHGPEKGKARVSRGGSFYASPWNCSCKNRDWDPPEKEACNLGFRVARTAGN